MNMRYVTWNYRSSRHHTLFMKLLIIAYVIQDVKNHQKTTHVGQECSVYELSNSIQLNYTLEGSKFSIGFLRWNTTAPPPVTQIFIHFEDKSQIQYVQVFINKFGAPVLRYKYNEKDLVSKSGDPLLPNQIFSSWYTLLIEINKNKVTVRRPDLIHILVKIKLPIEIQEKFQKIVITSPSTQHVVLNCLTKCPIFHSADVNNLMLNFNKPFDVHLTSDIAATNFNYGLSTPSLSLNGHFRNISAKIHKKEEYILKINITVTRSESDGDQCTITNMLKGKELDTLEENNCTNQIFTFIAYKSKNLSWSFNCEHHVEKKAGTHLKQEYLARKPPFGIGIGEVVAWIVASLSLTGLIIVALTLYTRLTSNAWMVGGTESAISNSHINSMEMVAFPRINTSMFFRELRKPEVGSVTNGRESNVSLDKLYPLKFEMEDNRSQRELSNDLENFSSIRSDKTTITTISNF